MVKFQQVAGVKVNEDGEPMRRRAFVQGLIASAVAAGVPLPIGDAAPRQAEMLFVVVLNDDGGVAEFRRIG